MTDLEKIKNGTAQVTPEQDLVNKLKKGKRLVIKLGMGSIPTRSPSGACGCSF